MTDMQAKRDSLELAVLFNSDKDTVGREAILRAFERTLGAYIKDLLSPELDDAGALQTRAKAMGIVETLTQMGTDIAHVMEKTPVRQAVTERVRQSLGIHY